MKISTFFRHIDNIITLNQRKRDEEKQKKKALMQLLLTGIVKVGKRHLAAWKEPGMKRLEAASPRG